MARVSKIKYNPSLSVAENARLNNCTVDAIRYYIRTRGIDRRYEGKMNIIEDIKKYLQVHPSAKKAEVARETMHGINQVKKYWDAAKGEGKTSQFKSGRKAATKIKSKFEEDKRLAIANKKELASELLKEADKVLQYVEMVDVSALRNWLMADPKLPLICVGSGGKHTSYPALLYQMMASIAKAVTPLEFSTISPEAIKNSKILLLSSSGKNIDIKYATKRALKYNPKNTACLTFTDGEDNEIVKKLGKDKSFVFKHEFKDGFISIRSKILTYAILYKAFSGDVSFAKKLRTEGSYTVEINKMGVLPAWSQINHYNVIYGSYGEPVAHDIESPMIEGGIASVQLCDYKNFCHGRFIFGSNHCSNRRVKKTDVCTILLISPREEFLAKKVRELALPDNMPVVEIRTELDNPLASIQLLIDALTFVFDLAEKQLGINPNSPPNYSSIDKRVPISGVHYEAELKRFGELHYGDGLSECMPNPKAEKLKAEIDSLVEREHTITKTLAENPSFLPRIIKNSLYDKEKTQYDMEKYQCVAFRTKGDLWKTHNVDLGNMNGGYAYEMNGVMFPSSEHAYIFGLFSNNTEEHKAIQEELLAEPSGYNAKRGIRRKYNGLGRVDWNTFNVEWMLYVVWQKALNNKEFRDILMALPQGVQIIEDVSFKPYEENGADFWGARNSEKKEFGKLAKKYAKSLELDTKVATNEAEDKLLWDYCNIGTYEGYNVMGKILTLIKQCLHEGDEPDIDYELLRSKDVYILGKPISFNSSTHDPSNRLMCGFIAGDMIGKPYERRKDSIHTTNFPLFEKRSKYTDDTILTIAIMDWLMSDENYTWKILEDKIVSYATTSKRFKGQSRCFSEPFTDWLKDPKREKGRISDSNGAVMRVAPIGWFFNDIETVEKVAEIQASLTHNHPDAICGAKAVAVAILLARQGKSKEEIRKFISVRYDIDLHYTMDEYRGIAEWTTNGKITAQQALISFLNTDNFEDAIRNAVALGSDADTVGAITGGIAEAFYGEVPDYIKSEVYKRAFPEEYWIQIRAFCKKVGF